MSTLNDRALRGIGFAGAGVALFVSAACTQANHRTVATPLAPSTTSMAVPSTTATTDPRAAAMAAWEAAHERDFTALNSSLFKVGDPSTTQDASRWTSACRELANIVATQRQALVPTPDAELTSHLTDMLTHLDVGARECIQALAAGDEALLNRSRQELLAATSNSAAVVAVFKRYAGG